MSKYAQNTGTASVLQTSTVQERNAQQVLVLQPGVPQQGQQIVQAYHPGYGGGNGRCGSIVMCIFDGIIMVWITTMGFVALAEIADSALDIMTPQAWMSVAWGIFSLFVVHIAVNCLSWACCPMPDKPDKNAGCLKRFSYPVVYQIIAIGGWVTVAAFLTLFYTNYQNTRPASHFVGFNSLIYAFIVVTLFTVIPFWYQQYQNCMCCIGGQTHGSGECIRGCCNCCSDGRGLYSQTGTNYVVVSQPSNA